MAYIQASFRNIRFNAGGTNTTAGNRLVAHEMPLFNDVVVESLGSKNREFKVNGFLAGADWEKQRDDLIFACELPSAGLLVHPDFGEIYVHCQSITVDENKITAGKGCTFELTFFQAGTQLKKLHPKDDTMVVVKTEAEDTAFSLANAFDTFYEIMNLPQRAMDYALSQFQTLTGVSNPYQFGLVYDSISGLLNGSYPIPYQITEAASIFTSAFNNDYSDDGVQVALRDDLRAAPKEKLLKTPDRYVRVQTPYEQATNATTPQTAYNSLIKVVQTKLTHCDTNSTSMLKRNIAGKRVELLVKGLALNEATVAAANIDFESIKEAQDVWANIGNGFTDLINLSAEINDSVSNKALKKQKAAFQRDVQNRAPEQNRIMHKTLTTATPTVVLSYRYYNTRPNETRSAEIVKRNNIANPVFAPLGVDLELLQE